MAIVVLLRATKPDQHVGVEIARNWVAAYDEGKRIGQSLADTSRQIDETMSGPHSLPNADANLSTQSETSEDDVMVGRNYE
jgi:hypothetical protein